MVHHPPCHQVPDNGENVLHIAPAITTGIYAYMLATLMVHALLWHKLLPFLDGFSEVGPPEPPSVLITELSPWLVLGVFRHHQNRAREGLHAGPALSVEREITPWPFWYNSVNEHPRRDGNDIQVYTITY